MTKSKGKILTVIHGDLGPNWCNVPGLALEKLNNKTVIECTYNRLRASKSVKEIVIISPIRPENHRISELCHTKGWHFHTTDNDKLVALLDIATSHGADTIIRVNAEQPLVDSNLIDAMVVKHCHEKVDYTYMIGAPNGTSPEAVSLHGLKELYKSLSASSLRLEPPTIPLRNMKSTVNIHRYRVNEEIYMSGLTLTVDTPTRLKGIENIYSHFSKEPDLVEIVSALSKQPDWYKVTPFFLNMEPTNICNLNCVMCDRKEFPRGMGMMDMDLYKSIINQAVQCSVNQVLFAGVGEPLLHKRIMEMISFAKNAGITRVHLSTNACYLNEEKGQALIDSGLDLLIISFDGATKKTYEKIRVGANYEEVMANVKNFLSMKRELEVTTPRVQIQIIRMTDTEDEVQTFKKMWKPFMNPEDFIREVEVWTMGGNVEDRRPGGPKQIMDMVPCWLPWQAMSIYWDGSVPQCCRDFRGKYKVGEFTKKSMIDIWNDTPIKNLRENLNKGNYQITKLCANCEGAY